MNLAHRTRIVSLFAIVMVAGGAAMAADAQADPAPKAFDREAPAEPAAGITAEEDVLIDIDPGAPRQLPPDTIPVEPQPKLDAASFGVGWGAAAAVGVALLAVLAMALTWKREPT